MYIGRNNHKTKRCYLFFSRSSLGTGSISDQNYVPFRPGLKTEDSHSLSDLSLKEIFCENTYITISDDVFWLFLCVMPLNFLSRGDSPQCSDSQCPIISHITWLITIDQISKRKKVDFMPQFHTKNSSSTVPFRGI